jgi:Fic family protein
LAYDPSKPFDDLPPLPPAADIETKEILKVCVRATRALAELKGAGGQIPDQAILINAIPLQEAKLSSEIENIVTTQDELFSAALDEGVGSDPQTKEVLRYRTALRVGFEKLSNTPLSMDMVREACSTIRGEPVSFRGPTEQVFIGHRASGRITYTPPRGGPALLEKLQNLEAFLLSPDGPDPLIRMAVAHYQFEAIHPFLDGNGRAGRILNVLYLLHAGLLDIPVLYLSRYIIHNKPDYYRLLRTVTESGDWESWVLYMLRGVEETATWTTERVRAIRTLFDETVERCRRDLPRIYSKELVELIFRQPYCRISSVVGAKIAERKTASVYLQELARIGILEPDRSHREVIYKNPGLLTILTM